MKFVPPLTLATLLLTGSGTAQHSLIVSPDLTMILQGNVAPVALGIIDDHESFIVTPVVGRSYEARPFRTITGIDTMHGDADRDGDLSDADLNQHGDLTCLFLRKRPPHVDTGPFGPGDIWMSVGTTANVATSAGVVPVQDGDVFRCRHGNLTFFVQEIMFRNSLGDSGAADFRLDGLAQDPQGNLYLSLRRTITPAAGPFRGMRLRDGDLLSIDASNITYNAQGLITAIAANTMRRLATEADVDRMVQNALLLGQNGTRLTAIVDASGLNLDPNGGVWQSPRVPNLTVPNLVFVSNQVQPFDTVFSTANNGSAAVINGVTMGYTSGAANGTKFGIGQLPSNQWGPNSLAVVPAQSEWLAIDSPLGGKAQQGVFTMEVGRLQPNAPVTLVFDIWRTATPGGFVLGIRLPSNLVFGNQFLEVPQTLVFVGLFANAQGYATLSIPDPGTVAMGTDLLVQAVGVHWSGVFSLSQTGNVTF